MAFKSVQCLMLRSWPLRSLSVKGEGFLGHVAMAWMRVRAVKHESEHLIQPERKKMLNSKQTKLTVVELLHSDTGAHAEFQCELQMLEQ